MPSNMLQAEAIKIDNLTPEELMGIMDDTLACLVRYLDWYNLNIQCKITISVRINQVTIPVYTRKYATCYTCVLS